jgi:hypothetical protein
MNPATTEPIKKRLRKQYINNLNLEAKNNKKNYDATKILQVTGEEPIRPPDMRSVEEKEKDVLNLKTLVRSHLMEITDGMNANQIVNELTNNELIFVANHMPYLIEELKPKFSLGIPAKIFLLYVKDLIRVAEQPLNNEYGQSNQTPQPETGDESMDVDDNIFFEPSAPPARPPSTRAPKRKPETEPIPQKKKTPAPASYTFSTGAAPTPSVKRKRGRPRKQTTTPTPTPTPEAPFSGEMPLPKAGSKRSRPIIIDGDRQFRKKRIITRPAFRPTPTPTPKQAPFSGEMPLPRAGSKRSRPIIIDGDRPLRKRHSSGHFLGENPLIPAGTKRKRAVENATPRKKLMVGRGLTKAPRISVDNEAKGVAKSKRYIPFGRYVINTHRLKNADIMMIKTMKGGAIANLPTVKISSPLSGLMQQMIDGHMPTFDDIHNLSIDDKQQLHHITKKCDIDVSVPNPDKDKLSQEMNRFDILKGEILAGNDNKEMVKEFKVMILRFMNSGRLPRRQGQEILTDLASMGY